jgi:hypothetical protein
MEMQNRKAQVVLAGSLGTVIGVVVMLLLNERLWLLGAVVGAIAVPSIWMYQEIARAVPMAARVAVQRAPVVWHVLVAIWHIPSATYNMAKGLGPVGKWRLASFLLGSSLILVATTILFIIPEPYLGAPFILLWIFYIVLVTWVTPMSIVPHNMIEPREEIKAIQLFMLTMTIVGILLFCLLGLYRSRKKIWAAVVQIGQFIKEFFLELFHLLYSQALIRSATTGFMGVSFAHFILVGAMDLKAGPTLFLSAVAGGTIGYFLRWAPKAVRE